MRVAGSSEADELIWSPSFFGLTDQGCVRPNNEDQFLIVRLERSFVLQYSGYAVDNGTRISQPSPWLMMVADGMGGHAGGEVASSVVVDAMAHYALTAMPWIEASEKDDGDLVEGMVAAVRRAQDRMLTVAARKQLDTRLGSTLTMGYLLWPNLLLFHVGDSRAYLYRDGQLRRLTSDHNLAQEMVKSELLSEQEARRSFFTSVLTNALGGGSDKLYVEQGRLELEVGDIILLCTDGLHGELDDAEIAAQLATLRAPEDVERVGRGLIEAAKAVGGHDNVTVVLARF